MTSPAARWLLRIVLIILPIGVGWLLFQDAGELRTLDEAVILQETRIDSLKAEHRKLIAELGQVKEEVGEMPETARLGHATRSAMSISKQQDILDGLIMRSRRRIQAIEPARISLRSRMTQVGLVGGLLWLATFAGQWVLRRRGSSSASA